MSFTTGTVAVGTTAVSTAVPAASGLSAGQGYEHVMLTNPGTCIVWFSTSSTVAASDGFPVGTVSPFNTLSFQRDASQTLYAIAGTAGQSLRYMRY